MANIVINGDCKVVLESYPDDMFDSVVTDPPYGLKFMGKDWDHSVPGVPFWQEFLRVSKPGAHLMAFGGTRTHHRLMVAIEDAGWEIRDTLMWVYGSGFPKSLDVSKAIDKAAGVEREVTHEGQTKAAEYAGKFDNAPSSLRERRDNPVTDAAKQWSGWGTALKPAWEPIILARKPLEGTVAENVLKWGCGGINVDGCRVETQDNLNGGAYSKGQYDTSDTVYKLGLKRQPNNYTQPTGRFPANLIHDGSQTVLDLFPNTVSIRSKRGDGIGIGYHGSDASFDTVRGFTDSGSAARFFYCAKASKSERNLGCDNLPLKSAGECTDRQDGTAGLNSPRAGAGRTSGSKNHHPTVKPLALLQYLCRLVTPPDGIVLDPFAGSGTTGIAAEREGFVCVMIELDADNYKICRRAII